MNIIKNRVARLEFFGELYPKFEHEYNNDVTIDKGIKEWYPACNGFLLGCFLGCMKSLTSADIYGDNKRANLMRTSSDVSNFLHAS